MMISDFNRVVRGLLRLAIVVGALSVQPAHAFANPTAQAGVTVSQKAQIDNKGAQSSVSSSCSAYLKGSGKANDCRTGEVPIPAASWLFIFALVAFAGLSTKRKV